MKTFQEFIAMNELTKRHYILILADKLSSDDLKQLKIIDRDSNYKESTKEIELETQNIKAFNAFKAFLNGKKIGFEIYVETEYIEDQK